MVVRKPFHQANRGTKSFPDARRFFTAAEYNHVGTLKEFLEKNPDAVAWQQDGRTALMAACEKGHYMAAQLLLQNGALSDGPQADEGMCPLHAAAKKDSTEVAGLLLHHRARIEGPNRKGITPLMEAARYNSLKMITLLLKRGAALDGRDNAGCTPLHAAATHGALGAAELLLELGADRRAKNSAGHTALDIARLNRDKEFAAAFAALVAARDRMESARIDRAFNEGADHEVTVRKPLRLRRRHKHP